MVGLSWNWELKLRPQDLLPFRALDVSLGTDKRHRKTANRGQLLADLGQPARPVTAVIVRQVPFSSLATAGARRIMPRIIEPMLESCCPVIRKYNPVRNDMT